MTQPQHNTAGKFARNDAGTSSLTRSGNCPELERLTRTRGEAFTAYLSARHHLSVCSQLEVAGHTAALETFEAARGKLRVSQRNWEEHVAAHHMG